MSTNITTAARMIMDMQASTGMAMQIIPMVTRTVIRTPATRTNAAF